MTDASKAFYLKQAEEFKDDNFLPLKVDPAMLIHKAKSQTICDAAAAKHENGMSPASKADIMKSPQQSLEEDPRAKVRDDLPTTYLGLNYKRSQQFAKLAKQDLLSNELQATFKDITSKVNALAYTVRPDIMFATRYLSTKKGKATKFDMTQLMKVVKKIKQDSNRIIIPNLGEPEDWILAGIVDASHRTSGNLFAVGGHVVMLINKRNRAASTIH